MRANRFPVLSQKETGNYLQGVPGWTKPYGICNQKYCFPALET